MKEIGGYFELELLNKSRHYHSDALRLNTARNCLEYILRAENYSKIYIPYYTCDVLLEPINQTNTDYEFYSIDEYLNPIFEKELNSDEGFLYTNYYGIKDKTVKLLAEKYGKQLIIDNAQSFFSKPIEGVNTFYSARKFFGVPDGAYLYSNNLLKESIKQDFSSERMSHLLKRIDQSANKGFIDYQTNDKLLNNQPIRYMSNLTARIMGTIDYESAQKKREQNFNYLHSLIGNHNLMQLHDLPTAPMVYPFLCEDTNLRRKLINNSVYVATYWKNVLDWVEKDSLEHYLVNNLLPLPIDHRYGKEDMDLIHKIIYES